MPGGASSANFSQERIANDSRWDTDNRSVSLSTGVTTDLDMNASLRSRTILLIAESASVNAYTISFAVWNETPLSGSDTQVLINVCGIESEEFHCRASSIMTSNTQSSMHDGYVRFGSQGLANASLL